MLCSLQVKNLALFSEAQIDFQEGFTTLTGETGAGKSLVVDALSLIAGARAGREMIRTGESSCEVSAVFAPLSDSVLHALGALGISAQQEGIQFTRVLSADGRNICRIDGGLASLGVFRAGAHLLLDVHEQEDTHALLDPATHLSYLDAFCKGALSAPMQAYSEAFQVFCDLRAAVNALVTDKEELKRRRLDLEDRIRLLETANLHKGEFAQLTEKRNLLQNAREIAAAALTAHEALGGENGAYDRIIEAASALREAAGVVPSWEQEAQKLEELSETLSASAQALGVYLPDKEDPVALSERIEARLAELSRLFERYGVADEEELLKLLDESVHALELLRDNVARAKELHAEAKEARAKAAALAETLSETRAKAAQELEARVHEQLSFLDMPKVRFEVRFTKSETLTAHGADEAEFYLAANVGEQSVPLAKTASGGELSRILLALRSVLATCDDIGTLVFDEIDTGISGKSAQKIGEALRVLSQTHQVLCVTHSAQVASCAKEHFLLEKSVSNGRTQTTLHLIRGEEREKELARILGGKNITQTTLANARELLAEGLGEEGQTHK